MTEVVVGIAALVAGAAGGLAVYRAIASRRVESAESRAARLVADAEQEAESKVRQALMEVKDEISGMRREAEADVKARREEIKRGEERLSRREEATEAKMAELAAREQKIDRADREMGKLRAEAERLTADQRRELERVSRLTAQEAKEALVAQVVEEAKRGAMATVREIEQRAREEGEERARKIVTIAIQRVASEQTAESSVSVFTLPSEDMKGRIIGREGRNIRAFEATTGVNIIIDDTPEAVVLSCFDPVRREAARMTLEKLVQDGRIQPARIEEVHERSVRDLEEQIRKAGEDAVAEVGLTDLHPELVRLLGRLQFRTSYGQNVLKHLVESAHIASALAAELGIDPT